MDRSGAGDARRGAGPGAVGDVQLFDRLAGLYDRFKPTTAGRKLRPALALAERDLERVLDVAGGSGQGVRALGDVDGLVLDAAPGMCRRARRRGVTALRGDAAMVPLGDETVDAVLVLDALHHVADATGAVEEAARVLRPGGVLVVLEFDPTTVPGRLLVAGEHLVGFGSRFFPPGNLEAMVRTAGLRPTLPRTGFEYTLAGVKPV
jgi:demethylmenaquinone methyltransferase/2-methoxy-6-polyprenyl-1,4-benzoquinol methylase